MSLGWTRLLPPRGWTMLALRSSPACRYELGRFALPADGDGRLTRCIALSLEQKFFVSGRHAGRAE